MLRWITAALVIAILAGAYFSYQQNNQLAESRANLKAAVTRAEKAQYRVEHLTRYATEQKALADSAQAKARRSVVRATDAERRLAAATTAQDSLPAAVEAKDEYKSAWESQVAASASLRARGDSLQTAVNELGQVVRDYGDASKSILQATKPSFIERLLPNVGAGAAVGADPFTYRPSTTVGVTLSWDF
jgi:hypothetical protein